MNGTILCYGQTGAGKTYTMTGVPNSYTHRGLIPRAIGEIFQEISNHPEKRVSVKISYIEIYNELMFDLLSEADVAQQSGELLIREDSGGRVVVKGLNHMLVHSEQEALQVFFAGNSARKVAEHTLNAASSRSHAIFTLHLESRDRAESNERVEYSKMHLVDLAGSERVKKTRSEGMTLKEASYINKSLTFLEQVVIALTERNREHIPYRQAKLTHYLKDSLGGNSDTKMIANIWPEGNHVEETASTMHFCRRMMKVTNDPQINYDLDPKLLLRKYEQEINDLKLELKMHDTLKGRGTVDYDPSPDEVAHMDKKIKQYLSGDPDVDAKTLCSDATTIRHHKLMFEMFKEQYEKREQELRERQAMRPDDVDGGGDGFAGDAEDLGAEDQGGVGVEEAGADAGFSLGFAGENNRPPEGDDDGMEETHSPKDAGEPVAAAPKAEKQDLFVTFKET